MPRAEARIRDDISRGSLPLLLLPSFYIQSQHLLAPSIMQSTFSFGFGDADADEDEAEVPGLDTSNVDSHDHQKPLIEPKIHSLESLVGQKLGLHFDGAHPLVSNDQEAMRFSLPLYSLPF